MGLNVASCLSNSATKFSDQTAIICEDRSYTFAELERWTAKIAEVLLAQGMKRGDHVLLLAPNVPEFTAVYYAVLRVGGVVVPANTLFLPPELAGMLAHSDSKFMIVWHTLAEKGAAAFEQDDACQALFFMGADRQNLSPALFPAESARPRFLLDELVGAMPGTVDVCQTTPDDTAVILYTSGTTGKSKGVELSHFNLYSNALYVKESPALDINPKSVTFAVLPLFHSFGQTAIQNASVMAGATMVMVPQFEPRRTLGEIEKHRGTHIAAVPTMYNLMLQTQRRYHYDVSSLQVAVSGGASLPVAIHRDFAELFPIKINEGYGLSETSPIACMTPANKGLNKPGSIGPAFYGAQVRVVREDGTFADVEEVGELVIRGHNVMKGYYKDPTITAAVFLEGGWFRSGDVGKMDADGYFFIVDRAKDVIIRAGMNIYPREIEEVLHNHPAVLEAAVVGIPDDTLSESVVAFVTLVPGAEITAPELQKYCRDRLAIYKCPKRIEFVEQLPKNSTGKIMKRDLRNRKGTV
ncbi:MAG: long-chain fatty acid--CoA ligase [Planctomycetaceae bacterium]|jgi:long-chain acyl-CoA synthetase|nr:long-chain fatty acid--CoA ligase [Planctomycetaceae bacterium]